MSKGLSKNDLMAIARCIHAIIDSDVLSGELETRIGVDEQKLCGVTTLLEHVVDNEFVEGEMVARYRVSHEDVGVAIHGCLKEVLYGINWDDHTVQVRCGTSLQNLEMIFEKVRASESPAKREEWDASVFQRLLKV